MLKKWLCLLTVVVCVCVLTGGGEIPVSAGGEVVLAEEEEILLPDEEAEPAQAQAVSASEKDVFTLLLVGTDSYTDDTRGRSDTMVLTQLDAGSGTVRMVSFLRDLYVKIPGHGSSRINASYQYGGAELLKQTLEQNFGVTADAYAVVNFERMVGVIDAIGGVEVTVSEAERKQLNSILTSYNKRVGAALDDERLAASGTQLLTGKQALCFSRIRKLDSDFQRTSRQRQVIEAAFRRVMGMNAAAVTGLVLGNMDAVTTDLTLPDILKLLPMARRIKDASFESMHVPVSGTYSDESVNGMSVLVPNLTKNRKLIESFLTD